MDTATDPLAPRIAHVAEPKDIQKKTDLAYLHSSHCLGSGDIMVSAMGDPSGEGKGNFILFDQELKVSCPESCWAEPAAVPGSCILSSASFDCTCMLCCRPNMKSSFIMTSRAGYGLQVKGTWTETTTQYGYDFWYQPRHNVMVSSQWGKPSEFTKVHSLYRAAGLLCCLLPHCPTARQSWCVQSSTIMMPTITLQTTSAGYLNVT